MKYCKNKRCNRTLMRYEKEVGIRKEREKPHRFLKREYCSRSCIAIVTHTGKIRTIKEKQKQSISRKGKCCGKNHYMFGKTLSIEHRQILSKTHKGKIIPEEQKQKIRDLWKEREHPRGMLGKHHTKEVKIRIQKIMKENPPFLGKCHTKKTRKKLSEMASKRIGKLNPFYGKQHKEETLRKIAKSSCIKPNKPELKLNNILQQLFSNEYRLNVKADIIIAGKIPDFINVNGQKKIIELYGDYWHRNTQAKDTKRQRLIESIGYKVLIVWEHELKNLNKLKTKLIQFHKDL